LNNETISEILIDSVNSINLLIKSITSSKDKADKTNKIYDFVAVLAVIYSSFIKYPTLSYEIIRENNFLMIIVEATNIFKSLKILSNYLTKVNFYYLFFFNIIYLLIILISHILTDNNRWNMRYFRK